MIVWETSADNAERWVAPANFVDWRREIAVVRRRWRRSTTSARRCPASASRSALRALGASGTFFTTLGAARRDGPHAAARRRRAPAPAASPCSATASGGAPSARRRDVDRPDAHARRPPHTDRRRHAGRASTTPLQRGIDVWLSGDRGVPRTFPFGGDLTAVRDSHLIFVARPARAGRDARGGAAGADRADGRAGAALPATPTPASASTSSRCTNRSSGDVRSLLLLLQLAVAHDAAHRVRQRRAPAARSGGRPVGRDDDAHGARRGARPAGAADARGDAGAGHSRRPAGPRDRAREVSGAARGGARRRCRA